MSKTITGNPLSGLQGVPPRIVLDKNSLTIKDGLLGRGTTYRYSEIDSVSLSMPYLYITPKRGSTIKLQGFYPHQFKEIQAAVSNCGYDGDDEDEEEDTKKSKGGKKGIFDTSEEDAKEAAEEERLQSETDKVVNMDVDPTDEKAIVKMLNNLITIMEANEGGSIGTDSEKLESLKKATLSKYTTQLNMLRLTYPENKLIPFFDSKIAEWKDKKKKRIRKTLILVLSLTLGPILLLAIIIPLAS